MLVKPQLTEPIDVLESFCGPGGMGIGFSQHFHITQAIDISKPACETYRANHHDTQVLQRDIRDLSCARGDFQGITGMIGGPPCQQWSRRNIRKKKNDPRRLLPGHYLRVVEEIKPEFFVLENVPYTPEIEKEKIIKRAKKIGYNVSSHCLTASDYGAAQTRRRWVVVGTLHGTWSPARMTPVAPRTVNDVFRDLTNNWGFMKSRPDTLEKLSRATTDWTSLSEDDDDYKTIIKLQLDKPAPAVVNVKKVYMVHPTEIRNISLAEAAALQGFPQTYQWRGGNQREIGQMIANAMPTEFAEALAGSIRRMLYAN